MRRAFFVGAVCAALAVPAVAPAADTYNSKALRKAVTVQGILTHEQALQDIADANGGTRAAGTPGNAATLDYIETTMRDAGYNVTRQPFDFAFFEELAPSTLERVSPAPRTYGEADFATMTYSGSGDVTAPLQESAGNQIPPGPEPKLICRRL